MFMSKTKKTKREKMLLEEYERIKNWSKNYDVRFRRRKDSVILTRDEWCLVLLHLGPADGNTLVYDKINNQVNIF